VRVVVQVHMLDEGWDVSTVSVIAPLRSMASVVNIRQVIGRGLRLPEGERLARRAPDSPFARELDYLDVLAFGQGKLAQVVEEANHAFGSGAVTVQGEPTTSAAPPSDLPPSGDDEHARGRRQRIIPVVNAVPLPDPGLAVHPGTPVFVDVPSARISSDLATVDLQTMTTGRLGVRSRIARELFIARATNDVMIDFWPASDSADRAAVRALVESVVDRLFGDAEDVPGDPGHLAGGIADHLFTAYASVAPRYEVVRPFAWRTLREQVIRVDDPTTTLDQAGLDFSPRRHRGVPISGWSRCAHAAATFDSGPELELARMLDRADGVAWWIRNSPRLLSIPTVCRRCTVTGVDFLVGGVAGEEDVLVLLEMKGDHLMSGAGSEAAIHARDVALWCEAANQATSQGPRFVDVVVDSGAPNDAADLGDVIRASVATTMIAAIPTRDGS
jgi:hypothetical protein